MSFLNDVGLQHLTNKLVQGDAIKVASHRGHTVKNVIDNITRECENVSTPNTMTLENRVNEFRVGRGRDVDVSGDVEEGRVEINLQGQTWQNLVFNITKVIGTQNCDVEVLDLNNLSFEMTYKNDITGNTSNNRVVISSDLKTMIKPDTIYTFIYKYTLLENPKGQDCQLGIAIDMWGQSLANSKICRNVGFSDINITKATSHDLERLNNMFPDINFINQRGQNTKWRIDGLIILEGDYTQTPVEEIVKYFQGIKSSFEDGVVDVEVVGKNLFDGKLKTFNTNNTYIDNIGGHNNGANNIPIKPNTNYVVTFETTSGDSRVFIWNGDEEVLTVGAGATKVRFKTPLECDSLSFYRNVADYTKDRLKYKIQIEEGVESTTYESYYKKKISFNIGEPLRSLPNGVCDEIRNNNGQWELVRRVRKTVLDETFDYTLWGNTPSDGYFVCHANSYLQGGNFTFSERPKNVICDKLPVSIKTGEFRNMSFFKTNPHITVSSSEANSIPEFKEWIAKNPITLYYELVNPVITQIEPIEFEVKPLATVTINSEITPVSNHTVVLNRAGQIEQGIVEIAELRKRVVDLETVYESHLLETQLKLSLLKLDHELEKEEI